MAEKPCSLRINGAYFGLVDKFERTAEIDPADAVFCEFSAAGYLPISLRLDEAFFLSPPPGVDLYYIRDGVALFCRDFVRSDPSLQVLWQERTANSRLTLCMQGRLQLNLENETGFHLLPLPEELLDCRPYDCGGEILLEGEHGFALIGRDGEVKLRTDGKILEKGELLRAEIPFADSMGHTAVMEWRAGKLTACTIRSEREPDGRTFALALFESVLIGADCSPFLAENLAGKAGSLRAFLGKFLSVVMTDDPALVGLVYARKPHVFDVRYFRVTLSGGKISNIAEE